MKDLTTPIRDLSGPWLDYAVFLAEQRQGIAVSKPIFVLAAQCDTSRDWYSPSMKAEHGLPIIERTQPLLMTQKTGERYCRFDKTGTCAEGPTYLIAFCRAYATDILGTKLKQPLL